MTTTAMVCEQPVLSFTGTDTSERFVPEQRRQFPATPQQSLNLRHFVAEGQPPPNPLSSLAVELASERLTEEALMSAYESFVRRITAIYQTHRWQARQVGERLDYSLPLLRDLVENYMATRACFYCGGQLSRANVFVDLKNPPSRGGSYAFCNVTVCCKDCQRAKGHLDHVEYRELLDLLRFWAAPIRRQFLRRLALAPSRREEVK